MKRFVPLMSCVALFVAGAICLAGCSVNTTGYSEAQGQRLHYHSSGEDLHFVLFTNIYEDAAGKSHEGSSDFLTLKGFLRKDGYLPVEYRSNGRTLTLSGKNYELDYALDKGRIFLVDARPYQSSPIVTQINLSPDEEAVFLAQWRQSKSDAVESLAADPRVKQFLDGSTTASPKP